MFKKQANQTNLKMSSVIGADMVIEGNIKAKDTVRIEGKVTGDVETDGALIISATAAIKGNAKGCNVIVGGFLEGDLTSGGKTEVLSTGKIVGNINTKKLVVDENAEFQGKCIMNEYMGAQILTQVESIQTQLEEAAPVGDAPAKEEEEKDAEDVPPPEEGNIPPPGDIVNQDNNFRKNHEKKGKRRNRYPK